MKRNFYIWVSFCYILATLFFLLLNINIFGQANVIMNHNDLRRTGWNNNETILATDNVSSGNFGKIFSRDVDDQTYSQPLVISNVSIGGGTHNIVIVTTVNNSIYAFDADDPNASTAYWQVNLTPTNYRPVKNKDFPTACTFLPQGYSDFTGNIGIVGTPAIDLSTNTLYVVARSVLTSGSGFVQYLHAIDIRNGNEKANSPVLIQATYTGTGIGNVGGVISFDPRIQNQRPGLLFLNGVVYIAWASHCDMGDFHGWVMGYYANTLQRKYVFNDTPNGGLGGIWMSGQPPSVDDDGNLILTSGNGTIGQSSNPNNPINRGNSLMKLSPDLRLLNFFTPMNYDYLNQNDLDYGSDGALLIPNTHLSISGSKEGALYLIDNNNMGGFTPDNSQVLERLLVVSSETPDTKNVHGTPVYYKDEYGNEYIYVWGEESLLRQYPFDRSNMLFDSLNLIQGNTTLPNGMPGSMLSVSSNSSQHGTGILWASHPINGNANWYDSPGILQAFDATDVRKELWNSNWNSKRDSIGIFAKFVPPTIANGKVYMATFSHKLNVYGLNPPPASTCTGTLPPMWQSADIGYDVYAGDVCVSNGNYTITASGAAIGGNKDGFHYVFQKVITNETELTINVNSFVNNTSGSKCGIMFRQNLDPGSPYVFLSLSPNGAVNLDKRTSQNGTSQNISNTSQSVPYYLRIYNNGNTYTSSYSSNGSDWTQINSVTLALGTTAYVGIAFTRSSNSSLGTAIVNNVALEMSGALSVNLIHFNGKNEDNKNTLLSWFTSAEINNDHFEIQRSGSNTNFKTIGTVKGNGSTTESHQYTFTDFSPQDGANYYRLKLVGADGSISYSSIVLVRFNFQKIVIYPNPASNNIYISNNQNFSKGKSINVELLDFGGKTLYKQQFKTNGENITTINIPSKIINGMYIIMVTNADGDRQGRQIFINR